MSRRTAREDVFKLTFEFLFYLHSNDTTKELLLADSSLTDEDKRYVDRVYKGIIDNFDALKELIAKNAVGYSVDRIYRPDFAALLLCAYELKFEEDVPAAVAISEAVELVKKFSSEKSNAFVNGVLSGINREINGGGQ